MVTPGLEPPLSEYEIEFGVPGAGSREAFEAWSLSDFGRAAQASFHVTGDFDNFYAAASTTFLPNMSISRFSFAGMTYERTPAHVLSSPGEMICIQYNQRGGLTGEAWEGSFSAQEGEVLLLDFSTPSRHVTTANAGLSLILPAAGLPRIGEGATRVVTGARGRLLGDFFGWLSGSVARAELADIPKTEQSVSRVVAACLRPGPIVDPQVAEVLGKLAVGRALAFIRAHCDRPLDVEQVAEVALVSRATLYRLFKPLGGVAEQGWAARLRRAQTMLSDPQNRDKLETIAHACGFATLQHFSRRFASAYGFSPRDLRPF